MAVPQNDQGNWLLPKLLGVGVGIQELGTGGICPNSFLFVCLKWRTIHFPCSVTEWLFPPTNNVLTAHYYIFSPFWKKPATSIGWSNWPKAVIWPECSSLWWGTFWWGTFMMRMMRMERPVQEGSPGTQQGGVDEVLHSLFQKFWNRGETACHFHCVKWNCQSKLNFGSFLFFLCHRDSIQHSTPDPPKDSCATRELAPRLKTLIPGFFSALCSSLTSLPPKTIWDPEKLCHEAPRRLCVAWSPEAFAEPPWSLVSWSSAEPGYLEPT